MNTVIEVLAALHDRKALAEEQAQTYANYTMVSSYELGLATAYDIAINLLSDLPLLAGRDR